ncbi:hypothetical protein L7F22_034623 [Adiantum nelumboides]|nr:hypothetical protein [Adiantum nelumboides]
MVELLFEDIFTIVAMDPDGKKFDKVSRIEARSEQFDMHMLLDVNTEIYPLQVDDKFTMALSSTLSLDGTPDDATFDQVSFLRSSVLQIFSASQVASQSFCGAFFRFVVPAESFL